MNGPLFCTEYVARGGGNTFESVMPILKKDKIAAINWGFVAGKTNTIYPWKSWDSTFTGEPKNMASRHLKKRWYAIFQPRGRIHKRDYW